MSAKYDPNRIRELLRPVQPEPLFRTIKRRYRETPLGAVSVLSRFSDPKNQYALDFLLDQGLVHKLESLHAFVGCSHPEHPHFSQFLICSDCGEVNEMESEAIAHSLHSDEKATGFKTRHPVVELLGTCTQCQTEKKNS